MKPTFLLPLFHYEIHWTELSYSRFLLAEGRGHFRWFQPIREGLYFNSIQPIMVIKHWMIFSFSIWTLWGIICYLNFKTFFETISKFYKVFVYRILA
jgi:hypothetical protein